MLKSNRKSILTEQILDLRGHLEASQSACTGGEVLDFQSEALEHCDVEICQRVVVVWIECQMSAVAKSAS
jgi:hypothetical protein